jgi:glycosyltransferase involved in cell wall biosynthesis
VRTAARLRGIPYVVTLHGGHFDVPTVEMAQMLQPIRHTVEWGKPFGALLGSRRVLEDAAAVICVGQNEYDQARAALPGQRVELLPNGVDSQFFAHGDGAAFRARHGIPADRKVILCVSRIDYQKNQAGLVEAMPEVLTKHPDSHLVLLGPVTVDSYHERLQKRIRTMGIGERVTLLPGLPPGDRQLADAYHAANLFCLPSLHEPFGIVVLEAWAAGLPVVAARVGGIPSFTENGKDVRHVDPADNRSIAAGISALLDNPDLAARLAARGREKALREYDWKQVSERLLAIYRDVIGGQT